VSVAAAAATVAAPLFEQWGWTYGWNDPHVPDAEELAEVVGGLLDHAADPNVRRVESGRFAVLRDEEYGSLHVYLHLTSDDD